MKVFLRHGSVPSPDECLARSSPSLLSRRVNGLTLKMTNALVDAKKDVAVAIADEKRLAAQYAQQQSFSTEWEARARTALKAGSEQLGKEALGRKVAAEEVAAQAQKLRSPRACSRRHCSAFPCKTVNRPRRDCGLAARDRTNGNPTRPCSNPVHESLVTRFSHEQPLCGAVGMFFVGVDANGARSSNWYTSLSVNAQVSVKLWHLFQTAPVERDDRRAGRRRAYQPALVACVGGHVGRSTEGDSRPRAGDALSSVADALADVTRGHARSTRGSRRPIHGRAPLPDRLA